ncbi:hypothetical protein VE03_10651, partial [Pseudogymnoascus sp. 23342-1-I1]
MGRQITDETFAQSRTRLTEGLREFNLAAEDLIMKVLKYLYYHLMARKLQNRLALAQFKAKHGWEDLTLDEHLRRQRPSSAGDMLFDTSSSPASYLDFAYPRT